MCSTFKTYWELKTRILDIKSAEEVSLPKGQNPTENVFKFVTCIVFHGYI